MKVIAIVIASFWLGSAAMAQGMMAPSPSAAAGSDCKMQAAKLSGAAFTSKVKSCCKKAATGKKLKGAAETSFETSCENTAKGS